MLYYNSFPTLVFISSVVSSLFSFVFPTELDYSAGAKNFISSILSFRSCSVVFLQKSNATSIEFDSLENVPSLQGISMRNFNNQRRTWSAEFVTISQKRYNCMLIVAVLNDHRDNQTGLEKFERKGNAYFIFILTSGVLDERLSYHQPQLEHKLYLNLLQDNDNSVQLKSAFNLPKNLNYPAIIFSLPASPLENKSFSYFFPNYFDELGFMGRTLHVSAATLAVWIVELGEENGGWKFRRGVDMDVINLLMTRYNFSVTLMPSSNGGGTGRLINGTWTGSVGDIYYGRADIGTPVAMTSERYSFVSYTKPYASTLLTFVVANPTRYYAWKSVYRPLGCDTWLMLAVCTVITLLIVKMFLLRIRKDSQKFRGLTPYSLLCYTFEVLVEKGSPKLTKGLTKNSPLVAYFSMWFIFSIVMGTAYRSKIIGFLMFPEMTPIPETFEDLANSDYALILQYIGGVGYDRIRTSTNPSHQKIFTRLGREPNVTKCVQATLHSHAICLIWKDIADYLSHSAFYNRYGQLPFTVSSSPIFFTQVAFIMRKNSHALGGFDTTLRRASSMGLFIKWSNIDYNFLRKETIKWSQLNNHSGTSRLYNDENDVLTIQHLGGAFMVLFTGLTISSILFIFSKLIVYVNMARNNNL